MSLIEKNQQNLTTKPIDQHFFHFAFNDIFPTRWGFHITHVTQSYSVITLRFCLKKRLRNICWLNRNHVLNKEEVEQEVESYKRKYYDALTQIGDALNTDTEGGHMENAVEVLAEKVRSKHTNQLFPVWTYRL